MKAQIRITFDFDEIEASFPFHDPTELVADIVGSSATLIRQGDTAGDLLYEGTTVASFDTVALHDGAQLIEGYFFPADRPIINLFDEFTSCGAAAL